MSEVIESLKASTDALENDLATVLEHWQQNKRIRYEAIVVKYPTRFEVDVRQMARERLSSSGTFRNQDIQFFIKTSRIELFEAEGVGLTRDEWIGRTANIPDLLKRKEFAEPHLSAPFRSLVWLHENEKSGERGYGLTACVEFGPMAPSRNALVKDVVFFEKSVGRDVLETGKLQNDFIAEINRNRHTKTWPIDDDAVDALLSAVRKRIHQFADYEKSSPDPNDDLNMETVDEMTVLRSVILRRNQSAFRRSLLSLRPNHCAISGTEEVSVLEAAHIIPYAERFADRDKPENGLLLRRDIHKLFDDNLIAINPDTRLVEVSPILNSKDYLDLKGKRIDDDLSLAGLKFRYGRFLKS